MDAKNRSFSEVLVKAKRLGFTDQRIGEIVNQSAKDIRKLRKRLDIKPVYKMVDTCAAEFEAQTPYFYSTYETENEAIALKGDKASVFGSGPIRIGQGIEFDYCSVHAAWALNDINYKSIMINSNPQTVSTDLDTSNQTSGKSKLGFSTWKILVLVLLLALVLRLWGIDWDQGGLFHPDERAFLSQVYDLEFPEGDEWSNVFDPDESTLNPGSFNWGSLPHYALKSVHYLVAPYKWMSIFDLRYAGRALSAVSDTFTVLLVFMIGRTVFSSRVGLLAALLSAIAVQQILSLIHI